MDYLEIEEKPLEVKKAIYGTLPFKFISKMIDASVISDKLNKEVGFAICYSKDKGFYTNDLTIGTKKQVPVKRCDNTTLGIFHTHPGGNDDLSIGDVYYAIDHKDKFMCIGSIKRKVITGVYVEKEDKFYNIKHPVVDIKCAVVDADNIEADKYKLMLKEAIDRINSLIKKMNEAETKEEFKKYRDEYRKTYFKELEVVGKMEDEKIIEYWSPGVYTSRFGVSVSLIVDRGVVQ